MQFDTASSGTVYNVHIDQVSVRGVSIPKLMSNTALEASVIHIIHPVVYIIKAGKKEKKMVTGNDSLAIYEKLLGKFKSIHAAEIIIENGNIFFSDKTGDPHTVLRGIDIRLKNFRIDSTRDYNNIISYFIKDVVVKVKEIYAGSDNNAVTFTDVEYNAPEKFIRLKKFQQKNKQQQLVFDINNTLISNISTDSFIMKQQLRAEALVSNGGVLTFYSRQNKNAGVYNDEIEMDNNYFDEALLNKVNIGNTKILIYSKEDPGKAPLILTDVKFTAADIEKIYSGNSIKNLISRSNWTLSAGGLSFMSENKRYKMNVGRFDINSANSTIHLSSFSVIPQFTEAVFSKSIKYQDDLYDMVFKTIDLYGVNTSLLLTGKRLEAETATLEPTLKIFNDRMVAPNPASKVGKYPHQLLLGVKFPVSIKKLVIKNGYIAYRERGAVSGKTGTVFFKNVNATVSNVTNVKDVINKDNMLVLNASALFMGVSDVQTVWKLPLNSSNGAFDVSGVAGGYNAAAMNVITEPLGMVSIRSGRINKLTFELTGTDLAAKGTSTLLYDGLKINLLKKDSADTKVKKIGSFVANFLVKDKNPQNGEVRKNDIAMERDITKSFFYLIWKSIFSAAQKTVAGKSIKEQ